MSFDETVTSAMVSDALDALGVRTGAFLPFVSRLSGHGKVIGTAATVQFAPAGDLDPGAPYDDMIEVIDGLAAGEVVVLAASGSDASAYWGELFSAAAIGRGATAVVTDGFVRDLDRIRALGFSAFASGTRPVDFRGRMRVVDRNSRVEIAGVAVSPGDVLVADADGIVVVPAELVPDVERLANDRASRESTVLSELLAGSGLRDVWTRHGIL